MQLPKLLESLITININFSDNRKIEILRGKESRGIFFISNSRGTKVDDPTDKVLLSKKENKRIKEH